jgi:hypothetical protein
MGIAARSRPYRPVLPPSTFQVTPAGLAALPRWNPVVGVHRKCQLCAELMQMHAREARSVELLPQVTHAATICAAVVMAHALPQTVAYASVISAGMASVARRKVALPIRLPRTLGVATVIRPAAVVMDDAQLLMTACVSVSWATVLKPQPQITVLMRRAQPGLRSCSLTTIHHLVMHLVAL